MNTLFICFFFFFFGRTADVFRCASFPQMWGQCCLWCSVLWSWTMGGWGGACLQRCMLSLFFRFSLCWQTIILVKALLLQQAEGCISIHPNKLLRIDSCIQNKQFCFFYCWHLLNQYVMVLPGLLKKISVICGYCPDIAVGKESASVK